jgi:hypothetical protein
MRAKLCFGLVAALLFGALCIGNPCLPEAHAGTVGAPPPAVPVIAVDAVAGRSAVLVGDPEPWPPCPDAQLAAFVRAVEFAGDEPVWVLHDGRRVVRNPRPGPGEPLVVDWTPDDDG